MEPWVLAGQPMVWTDWALEHMDVEASVVEKLSKKPKVPRYR